MNMYEYFLNTVSYICIYVPVSLSEGGGGPAIWLVTLYNTRNIP